MATIDRLHAPGRGNGREQSPHLAATDRHVLDASRQALTAVEGRLIEAVEQALLAQEEAVKALNLVKRSLVAVTRLSELLHQGHARPAQRNAEPRRRVAPRMDL
jgi:hypothetical protein